LPELGAAGTWGIVVAGVGGTGVITIGQLLGMAGHIEGKGIVTQDAGGLAQKGGATWSHVLIGTSQDDIHTTRVGMAGADLVIGCDPIVTAGKETVLRMRAGRTHVALNGHSTPTAAFVKNADWQNPAQACVAEIRQVVGESGVGAFDADAVATRLMGDSIYTNPMMLGYAWQKGWVPLDRSSILRAMELNAVAVEQNKAAFQWGCHAAHDWPAVERLLAPSLVVEFKKRETLDDLIERRAGFLTGYQSAAYAQAYRMFIHKVRDAEAAAGLSGQRLSEAVARNLFKLMAYKDEYEVARLHTDPGFLERVASQFEGDFTLHYHLAPPLIAKKNEKGELQKRKFGPAMLLGFRVLAKLKGLRGSAFDIFGRTAERRAERALIGEYQACMDEIMQKLDAAHFATALEIARIPEQIKGFGHVKERHLQAARLVWADLMERFHNQAGVQKVA
jgi:indolepyruvate ferredoxin oxidoreductase